jgi:hypothetical protein
MAVHKMTDTLFMLENNFVEFVHSLEIFMEEQRDGQPISGLRSATRIPPRHAHPSLLVRC